MHMADALVSTAVGATMCVASVGAIGYSIAKTNREGLGEKKVPIMAVSGALVFAAQMINFTIPGTGSSGHIGGGILLAGLLGGSPALLTIATVLLIQALFFADGGLLALGCNIFNMGIIPCLLIYPLIMKPILKKGVTPTRITLASILSVVIGLQLGAFGVVLETLASGITELPFHTFVLLMQPIHLVIGVVEGIVTAAILCFVHQMRPEIMQSAVESHDISKKVSIKKVISVLAILTLVTAGGLSLFASPSPDGLEWAMERTAGTTELSATGTVHENADALQKSTAFLPDYNFAQSGDEEGSPVGTSVSGIVGGAITFALAGMIALVITKFKRKKQRASE